MYRRRLTLELFFAVVYRTPVDTGQLRGNWLVSEGSPNTTPRYGFLDKTGEIVRSEIEMLVEKSTGDRPLFLSNSVFYAHRIEYDGWSHTKAPEGMVRISLLRFGSNRTIFIKA